MFNMRRIDVVVLLAVVLALPWPLRGRRLLAVGRASAGRR